MKEQVPPFFRIRPLYWLLVALPVAILLEVFHADPLWVFIVSCVAIIPLAGLMGRATENLAESMGPAAGGLLNATFGNAAELIIALLALYKGEVELVKASITGSIIGNVLLVLGLSILCGGLRFSRQTFNATAASLGATLLALAVIGLVIPTIHYQLLPADHRGQSLLHLSEEIAAILALMYVLSLIFTLKTHRHLFAEEGGRPEDMHDPEWSRKTALIVLLASTAGVALMSEFLVGSVNAAGEALGLNRLFIGIIVVAVIGNAAEHSSAVLMAIKNKMDLSYTIAVGSSIQIALFVAPALVSASLLMGTPMDLHFSLLEVVAVGISIAVVSLIGNDGESHWMEGALLLAVYVIIGLAFYHYPEMALTP